MSEFDPTNEADHTDATDGNSHDLLHNPAFLTVAGITALAAAIAAKRLRDKLKGDSDVSTD